MYSCSSLLANVTFKAVTPIGGPPGNLRGPPDLGSLERAKQLGFTRGSIRGAEFSSRKEKGKKKYKRLLPVNFSMFKNMMKRPTGTLAHVAQWIECWFANQGVIGLIPSQGTCLGCRPGPQLGCSRGNQTLMFLSLSSFLAFCLKVNK